MDGAESNGKGKGGMGGGLVPGTYPPPNAMRPSLVGEKWAVVAGHAKVSNVAAEIFASGGNAVDAGVAAGLASNVVQVDMNSISERVEIRNTSTELKFSCEGNFASTQIYRTETDGYTEFIQRPTDPSVVTQGVFSTKSLLQFIKCTPLCNTVELYLSNDMPLICSYECASLGSIRLCLSSLPVI